MSNQLCYNSWSDHFKLNVYALFPQPHRTDYSNLCQNGFMNSLLTIVTKQLMIIYVILFFMKVYILYMNVII